jgi:Fe-S cluster biogenesis protein NfuA
MDRDQVTGALQPLRQLLEADGGDVTLIDLAPADGSVRLRLDLREASCADCVMPRPHLEQVAFNVLRRGLPDLKSVHVEDPRDHSIDRHDDGANP